MSASPRNLLQRFGWSAAVVACYAVLAGFAYWPVGPLAGNALTCRCGDPTQQLWFLSWVRFALAGGHNPLLSTWQNYPHGVNVAANPSMPLLGLLGAPLSWLLGPISTFNLLLRLAFVCSASAMYAVLRRVTASRATRFLGGLAYGFSPYLIGQGALHLNLAFVPLPPLLLANVYDLALRARDRSGDPLLALRGTLATGGLATRGLATGARAPRRIGVTVGLLAAAQFLVSPEILADTAVLVVTGFAGSAASGGLRVALAAAKRRIAKPHQAPSGGTEPRAWVRSRARVWQAWRDAAVGAGWTVGAFGLVAGYPAWFLAFGPQHPTGPPLGLAVLDSYSADLFGSIVPTTHQLLGPHHLQVVASGLAGSNLPENGAYLGIPLLACLIAVVVWRWREPVVRICALVGAAALVLSLGPTLVIWGTRTTVGLPFALLARLPLLDKAVPLRYTLFVQLCAAVLLTVGIDRIRVRLVARRQRSALRQRPALRQRLAVGGVPLLVAAGALAPLLPRLPYLSTQVGVPAYFSSNAVRAIQPGAVVLTYPYPVGEPTDSPLLWQAVAGLRFRLIGGYALVARPGAPTAMAPSKLAPASVVALFKRAERRTRAPSHGAHPPSPAGHPVAPTSVNAAMEHQLRTFLWRYGAADLLVDPHSGGDPALVIRTATAALGRPHAVGGMLVWKEPRHASSSSW
ncbi:MAG: hypothetical protein ACRDY2_11405 [Acidimicrobiales bacterium]